MQSQYDHLRTEYSSLRMEHDNLLKISHEFQQRIKQAEQNASQLESIVRQLREKGSEHSAVEQKMLAAMEEVGRLQLLVNNKDKEL